MRICSYFRVSTAKQGASGLGLEAQVAAVDAFKKANHATEVASFREVESGKNSDRPELAKALAFCRRSRCVLVVAKLDRLARNVRFLAALMESDVQFVACDNPNASKLTLHILASVAEDECRRISQRTKDALGAAKRRGVLLGSARPGHWNGREKARLTGMRKAAVASIKVRTRNAKQAREDLRPIAEELQGLTLEGMAKELNERGLKTRTGCEWNAFSVLRLRQALRGEAAHA